MSASSTQFTFLVSSPTESASRARCGLWPRTESVREPEEVGLVDRVEHLDDGALDDLVLQRGNAERSIRPFRLRDVRSPHRLHSVRPPLQPAGEVPRLPSRVVPSSVRALPQSPAPRSA